MQRDEIFSPHSFFDKTSKVEQKNSLKGTILLKRKWYFPTFLGVSNNEERNKSVNLENTLKIYLFSMSVMDSDI